VAGFGSGPSAFDRFQQRHRSIGFALVLQKYGDDQGGYTPRRSQADKRAFTHGGKCPRPVAPA
jgi:hypothetical protein